jgi:Raf kinase inhibitor-like YbhB/YbcL family protein
MDRWWRAAPAAVLAVALTASCADGPPAEEATIMGELELTSDAFVDGGQIPPDFTCDGADVSPPLAWDGAPDGTAAYALIVDDPDARGFIHWVVAHIPGDVTALERDASARRSDLVQGPNDFGRAGYGGPCPPSGSHRYVFRLFALSEPLEVSGAPDAVRAAVEGRVLGEATLSGTYRRGG